MGRDNAERVSEQLRGHLVAGAIQVGRIVNVGRQAQLQDTPAPSASAEIAN